MVREKLLYRQLLYRRYQTIFSYIGLIGMIVGIALLAPLLALLAYPEEIKLAWGFALPGITLLLLGMGLWRRLALQGTTSLTLQEGAMIVVLSWLLAIAISTIPLLLIAKLNLTQAVFESTSGWTTTGLSVINVTQSPHIILLFRSITQLLGGAGFAIIALSAITAPAGVGLATAEGRGEQLAPNVRRSAKLVLSIYTAYIALGIVALRLVGMEWFDAINHSFTAISTGGFSTRRESIGEWNNPMIEVVIIGLMLLGSWNYVTCYLLLKGKIQAVWRNAEMRLQAFLLVVGGSILFLLVTPGLYTNQAKAMRVSIFETIAALSTTGYATVSYINWKHLGWLIMIILMLVGGGTGSTAGGIKLYRIYIIYRSLLWEVRRMLLPTSVVTEPNIWHGNRQRFLNDSQIRQISMFVFLYLFVYVIGSGIITAYGYSLPESLFEYASTLSTVGLSVGVTTADAPAGLLWTEIVGMFLGRLEFLTVFVGIIQISQNIKEILG
ncbi:MAG: TrkH family potassium uptake protein [Calothrix sp. MO_192.B10]|nr:TrkH family potassium uptake protein [Calothrix sp. MO_192.B10]